MHFRARRDDEFAIVPKVFGDQPDNGRVLGSRFHRIDELALHKPAHGRIHGKRRRIGVGGQFNMDAQRRQWFRRDGFVQNIRDYGWQRCGGDPDGGGNLSADSFERFVNLIGVKFCGWCCGMRMQRAQEAHQHNNDEAQRQKKTGTALHHLNRI